MPTVVKRSEGVAARPRLWRITDRDSFQDLRRHGRRARRGPVGVTWMAPRPGQAPTHPRAGFVVGKSAGGSVARNRVRRRLRAALRQLLAEERLPAGTYLLGAGPEVATMPWSELVELVQDAISEAHR